MRHVRIPIASIHVDIPYSWLNTPCATGKSSIDQKKIVFAWFGQFNYSFCRYLNTYLCVSYSLFIIPMISLITSIWLGKKNHVFLDTSSKVQLVHFPDPVAISCRFVPRMTGSLTSVSGVMSVDSALTSHRCSRKLGFFSWESYRSTPPIYGLIIFPFSGREWGYHLVLNSDLPSLFFLNSLRSHRYTY